MVERFFNPDDPIAFVRNGMFHGTWHSGDQLAWLQWGKPGVQPPNELIELATRAQMQEPGFLPSKESPGSCPDNNPVALQAT